MKKAISNAPGLISRLRLNSDNLTASCHLLCNGGLLKWICLFLLHSRPTDRHCTQEEPGQTLFCCPSCTPHLFPLIFIIFMDFPTGNTPNLHDKMDKVHTGQSDTQLNHHIVTRCTYIIISDQFCIAPQL